MSEDIFRCYNGEEHASGMHWPAVLPNTLQRSGQSPTTKNHPAQNANSAEVEKPCCILNCMQVLHSNQCWE